MRRIGPRHLDNRRNLLPRDYFENPWTFGTPTAKLTMPSGGDDVSQRVAFHVNVLVRAVREHGLTSRQACTRFGFCREVWSDVVNGRRWPGETVLTAILDTIADRRSV